MTTLLVIGLSLIFVGSAEQILSFDITPIDINDEEGYACYRFPLDTFDIAYLEDTSFDIKDKTVHHIGVAFCENPKAGPYKWRCDFNENEEQIESCNGAYATLIGYKPPKETSIALGKATRLRYALVEVHYGRVTKESNISVARVNLFLKPTPSKYLYQTYMLSNSGYIPGNETRGYFSEVACEWKNSPVTAYLYNPHVHAHVGTATGILAEGFLIRNGTWSLLGGHLSKVRWDDPRAYNIIGGPTAISAGDILAARCLFRNDGPNPVPFGFTEQMCVYFIMFGYDAKYEDEFSIPLACNSDAQEFSFCKYPETSGICVD